jgi:hypothetical protein
MKRWVIKRELAEIKGQARRICLCPKFFVTHGRGYGRERVLTSSKEILKRDRDLPLPPRPRTPPVKEDNGKHNSEHLDPIDL